MKIVIDNREHSFIKLINTMVSDGNFNCTIEIEKLDLGDISIRTDDNEELLLIERKCVNDLAASIKDGRYKEQSYRLKGYPLHNHNIFYLIEGNIHNFRAKYSKMPPSTLYVTTFCLNYFKGFSLIRTYNLLESVEYVLRMTDKLHRESDKYGFYHEKFVENKQTYANVIHTVKKNNITPENIGNIILSQIPGVSVITAKVIIEKFGSLFQLLKVLETDKKCLEGIKYTTKTGKERSISKTSIKNTIEYLLYQNTETSESLVTETSESLVAETSESLVAETQESLVAET